MQGYPLKCGEDRYLPSDVPIIPQRLGELGYVSHLVGKWHLGYSYRNVTPTGRGFHSHFGYWNGHVGYFDYQAKQVVSERQFNSIIQRNYTFTQVPSSEPYIGFDLRDNLKPARSFRGKHATDLFTEKAIEVIKTRDKNVPFFLMVSHLAPHTGKNGTDLEVPDVPEAHRRFHYIKEEQRRLYAGEYSLVHLKLITCAFDVTAELVRGLDDSVGRIVKSLSDESILRDTIVMYISDNGGQTIGLHENSASNWPLRGVISRVCRAIVDKFRYTIHEIMKII